MPLSSRGSPAAPAAADYAAARVYDLTWPDWFTAIPTEGTNASLNGLTNHQAGNREAWGTSGSPAPVYAMHKGRPCIELPPAAGGCLQSKTSFVIPLEKPASGELSPGALFGRVIIPVAMAAAGGDNQQDTGLYFADRASGNIGNPSINAAAFGLSRDGADGWQWFITGGGGTFQEELALAWPVAQDDWCDVEFRLYPATRTDEAKVELYTAGILRLSRAWGAGSLLPAYDAREAGAMGWGFGARTRDMGASESMLVAGARFILSTVAES